MFLKGTYEDSFGWLEDTLAKLGTGGLVRYISDTAVVKYNPDLVESAFYALQRANTVGLGKHVSKELMSKKIYNPIQLWTNIETYYNNNINKADVILYKIKCLPVLELTMSVKVTKFISDYKDCL